MRSLVFEGIELTDDRLAALIGLARCPNGSAGVVDVLPGALLATLVQMGLADRAPPLDSHGGASVVGVKLQIEG